jgi:DNA-binding response OmpR family regulator
MRRKLLLNLILVSLIVGFCTQISSAQKKKVIFVTQGDSLFVDALGKKGYDVTTTYPGTGGWDFSKLNFADIVVIGRSMNSGDFKDVENWSKVEVPVLCLSAPAARSSRLKLLNSKTHNDFTFEVSTDTLWAKFADTRDPIVKRFMLNPDSTIDYSTSTHSLVQYGADSLERTSSAKLLATAIAPDTLGGNRVLACRWKAGVETYPASGMIPASIWSYIALSGFSLTDNGLQMCVNEMETLLKMSQPNKKKIIFVTNNDTLFVDAFIKEGYDVTTAYPGTAGWDFSKLNFADLVVIGRSMNSGDFKDIENWSKVEVPVLCLSAPAARSSRLKLLNSKEHNDFVWPSSTDILLAKIADLGDPIVKGLMVNPDSTIDYSAGTHSLVKYGADSLEATSSAKLLASTIAPDTLGGNRVLGARWQAGAETYTGSGMIPSSIWTYLAVSGFSSTRNGLEMCFNEAEYLINQVSNSGKKITFVTTGDQKYVDALKLYGYDVSITYPGTAGWDFAKLNFADVVIIGRSSNSSDFKDFESWSMVEPPVISLAAPVMRSSRLKFFDSKEHNDFVFPSSDDILWAKFADAGDPMAKDLDLNAENMIDYSTGTHSLVKYGADSLEVTNSAKLIATAIAPDTLGGGRVLACRWQPGNETYPGSGMVPTNVWTYMAVSGSSLSNNGMQMLINEIEANTIQDEAAKEIIFVTQGDSLYIDALTKDGYIVTTTYPGQAGFSFSKLNFANLVIIGRSSNSGDFKDFESWSKVKPPVFSLAAPVMRSSRLKIMNSKEHNDFTFANETDTLFVKIADVDDPFANDLTLDADQMVDYSTATHSLVKYGADSLEVTHNAKLLATAIAPDTLGGGRVLAARWEAGLETYPGSGMIPTSTWSYMAVSGFTLTDNGYRMMINEIEFLANQYDIPDLVPADSIAVYSEGGVTTLDEGKTLQMYVTILPVDATNQDVVWSVDNESLATIDQNGLLTAVQASIFFPVTVIATNEDGLSGTMPIFITTPVSVDDLNIEKVDVYYNRNHDVLMLSNSKEVERIEIYNIAGQRMFVVNAYNQERIRINTNSIIGGFYVVRVKLKSNRYEATKFIK